MFYYVKIKNNFLIMIKIYAMVATLGCFWEQVKFIIEL